MTQINAFGCNASLATRHEAWIGDMMRQHTRQAHRPRQPGSPPWNGVHNMDQVMAARKAVLDLMADGNWRSRDEITARTGATTNTVSHFRKTGDLEKRRTEHRVLYRLVGAAE